MLDRATALPPAIRLPAVTTPSPSPPPGPLPLSAIPCGPLRGRAEVPGDKSISHRALILGAVAEGDTEVEGLLESADVLATAEAMTALGAPVERCGSRRWRIRGRGIGGLREPETALDFGNSGTGARLTMGLVAGHSFAATFLGDASLSARPMGRVLEPLRRMGTAVIARSGDRMPLSLRGAAQTQPIRYRLPVASAQVKSAILLAGLGVPGTVTVLEPVASRDHTERMLRGFGADIEISREADGTAVIRLAGRCRLDAQELRVPADPSSAAFLLVAALIVPESSVTVPNVMLNPTRSGLIDTLREMGADITIDEVHEEGGERLADITARHSRLKGVVVPARRAASMIDEYPVLAVAAAFAEGRTEMLGLGELRVKESDRLATIAAGLRANGVACREGAEALVVEGLAGGVPGGGVVDTHLDHRIAMSFLTLGLGAAKPVTVDDTRMIATSFPGFVESLKGLGGHFETPAGEEG